MKYVQNSFLRETSIQKERKKQDEFRCGTMSKQKEEMEEETK